ncbi:MAG: hypothetical protein GXP45_07960 [bacterium]|nr:hypothetical protein [bacterium]
MYYNSQRGERLWPLDIYSLQTLREGNASYSGLHLSGALYTVCDDDVYAIFGQVSYDWSGTSSAVTAGTKLDYRGNWLSGNFANSFEYFNNMYPLGYIVDTVGGIGFV